jgi:imidazole glycerol-phosphate synthase subunit HisH
MIVIIDYGMGNVKSVINALEILGEEVIVSKDYDLIRSADAIILPGVGAFRDGMKNLDKAGLIPLLNQEVIEKKKPFLGICLGLQLLAKKSYEHGAYEGLGWVDGEVTKMGSQDISCKIPHIGWNDIKVLDESVLFKGLNEGVFYFVHSYSLVLNIQAQAIMTSTSNHGLEFVSSVRRENIFGVQFHPEKSQFAGLKVLTNFVKYIKRSNINKPYNSQKGESE